MFVIVIRSDFVDNQISQHTGSKTLLCRVLTFVVLVRVRPANTAHVCEARPVRPNLSRRIAQAAPTASAGPLQ